MNSLSVQIANKDIETDMLINRVMSNMNCACFAIVTAVNYQNQTIDCKATIRKKRLKRDGTETDDEIAQFLDVPFQCPSGGNYVCTFPVSVNDEVLIVFTDLDYSAWFQNGGIQNIEHRFKHATCNAVAIIGYRSTPSAIPNYSQTAVQLRTKDGTQSISLSNGQIDITSATINLNGNVNINGNTAVTGTFSTSDTTTLQGKDFLSHTHTSGAQGQPTGGVN